MDDLQQLFAPIKAFMTTPLASFGGSHVTLWSLLQLLVLAILLFLVSGMLRTWTVEKLLAKTRLEVGARQATGSILRYVVLAIGFVVILQTAGIDLTALNVLTGAVGIGVGFGLQNVVNNFISGLIILFERPIKVGDRIEVGEVEGDVVHIGARSTTVVTNDNISIIVPNAKFINDNVVNWSHNDRKVRFRIPVSVAYGSDLELVRRLLLEAAEDCPDVLATPAPAVRLMSFDDYALGFELRAWSTTLIHRRGQLTSDLNLTIYRKFTAHGVVIPYPRRDVHLFAESSPPR